MADNWSDAELEAAVAAYIDLRERARRGQHVVKSEAYKELAGMFPERTGKAFEFRMQNISYVYSLMGREWVAGLRPARNVGARNAERIQLIIERFESQDTISDAAFAAQVENLRGGKGLTVPSGQAKPAKQQRDVTIHRRDPAVVAWVLDQAVDECEACGSHAPFLTAAGRPYLEVHHLRRLADGGPDTVDNAAALCPNCHRALHYSQNAEQMKTKLIQRVARLTSY